MFLQIVPFASSQKQGDSRDPDRRYQGRIRTSALVVAVAEITELAEKFLRQGMAWKPPFLTSIVTRILVIVEEKVPKGGYLPEGIHVEAYRQNLITC